MYWIVILVVAFNPVVQLAYRTDYQLGYSGLQYSGLPSGLLTPLTMTAVHICAYKEVLEY
jgi:hypothetical protein